MGREEYLAVRSTSFWADLLTCAKAYRPPHYFTFTYLLAFVSHVSESLVNSFILATNS